MYACWSVKGGVRRIEGWANFVMEYDITDK
jgi:hypothetical protein